MGGTLPAGYANRILLSILLGWFFKARTLRFGDNLAGVIQNMICLVAHVFRRLVTGPAEDSIIP